MAIPRRPQRQYDDLRSKTEAYRHTPITAGARLPGGIFLFAALALGVLAFILVSGILVRPATGAGADATTVSAGFQHTCALTTAGGVSCWGSNDAGQLGDGTTTNSTTPVSVVGLSSGVVALSSGLQHTCALTTADGVKCWGFNGFGQLGDGTTTNSTTPVDVSGLTSGVATISAGRYHTCAVTTGGGAKCWGSNFWDQLGDGSLFVSRTTPVDVSGLTSGVASVSAGDFHTCAVTTGSGAKCWGDNIAGQLGDGTTTDRTTPVDVSGLTSGVAAVSAGRFHTCALTTTGGVQCWGSNSVGQLGDGTTGSFRSTPLDVVGLSSGGAAVSAGRFHTCAVTTGGGAKCWGDNGFGQLGDATTTDRNTPVDVSGLTSGVGAVTAGGEHTCARTTAGSVNCWGNNVLGQLGDGTTIDRTTPVEVVGFGPIPTPTPVPTPSPTPVPATVLGGSWTFTTSIANRVEITVSSLPLEGLGAADITVAFDPAVLAITDCDTGDLAGACNPSAPGGPAHAAGFAAPAITTEPVIIAGLVFDCVAAGAASSTLTITINELLDGTSPGGQPIPATIQNGTVDCADPDNDGDGVLDVIDNCPAWPNPAQNLPPWPVPVGDADCDSFTDVIETFVGTDPNDPCADTDTKNDEADDKWPTDTNDNKRTNTLDIPPYISTLNSVAPGPPYVVRLDLNMDNKINTLDVAKFVPVLNYVCTP